MMRGAPLFVAMLLAVAICFYSRIGLVAVAAVVLAAVLEDWASSEHDAKRREERERS